MAGDTFRVSSAIGILVCAAAIALCPARAEEASGRVYSLLAGEWGGNQEHTCESNPHVISFSADKKRATFTYQYAPGNSHDGPVVQPEKLSPEYGSQDTIDFYVLDHGKTWIALRRVGEKKLDRLGKPQTWKLRLTKDKKGYRWQLYNGVASRKSLLRGSRCEPDE